ncbi:MAG: excalibur calcium-binding domain-containing protein [bacterium]
MKKLIETLIQISEKLNTILTSGKISPINIFIVLFTILYLAGSNIPIFLGLVITYFIYKTMDSSHYRELLIGITLVFSLLIQAAANNSSPQPSSAYIAPSPTIQQPTVIPTSALTNTSTPSVTTTLSTPTPTPTPIPIKAPPTKAPTLPPADTNTSNNNTDTEKFHCAGKTTCGQMISCTEAKYYLNACGVKRLDGNKDGVPCESLCK